MVRIITGQVARKDSFWDRKQELEDIWYKINSSSHTLLVAPRRVGKTSIMYKIMDNPQDDYIVLYVDVESADKENEFWKKLFSKLMEEEFVNTLENKAKNFFRKLKTIKIDEISTNGVKFGDGLELDYAKEFIKALAIPNNIKIEEKEIEYLLEKIEWLIPFYIQLIMDELRRFQVPILEDTIDKAFHTILDNKNHFDHWRSRLQTLADNEYIFAKEILNIISENTTMQSNEIINIATKNGLNEEDAKEVIHSLVYDGYIHNNNNSKEYRFNSPILKMWWYKNVAN